MLPTSWSFHLDSCVSLQDLTRDYRQPDLKEIHDSYLSRPSVVATKNSLLMIQAVPNCLPHCWVQGTSRVQGTKARHTRLCEFEPSVPQSPQWKEVDFDLKFHSVGQLLNPVPVTTLSSGAHIVVCFGALLTPMASLLMDQRSRGEKT
jgi:hypothetical protein